jgi:hypothetical protein
VKAKESDSKTHTIMDSNNVKFPDDPTVTLTIRLIMQGKVSCLLLHKQHTDSAISLSQLSTKLYLF